MSCIGCTEKTLVDVDNFLTLVEKLNVLSCSKLPLQLACMVVLPQSYVPDILVAHAQLLPQVLLKHILR